MAKPQVSFPYMEELEEDEENVVSLGSYPSRGEGDEDWLMKLPIGSEFLSRSAFTMYELDEYEILEKTNICVKLLYGNNIDNHHWVISRMFSKENLLVEVLHYGRNNTD